MGGRPKFLDVSSSSATLLDPGRSPATSPLTVAVVLGVGMSTPSPSAVRLVSRLNCFSAVRLALAADELACVSFRTVVRSDLPSSSKSACPSDRQHLAAGGWLDLSITVLSD